MFAETSITDPMSIIAMLLMGLSLYGISLFFTRPKADKKSDIVNVRWGALEGFAALVAIFLAAQLFAQLIFALLNGPLRIAPDSTIGTFVVSLVGQAGVIGLVFLFLKRRRTLPRLIGWKRPIKSDIKFALAGYTAYFAIFVVVVMLTQILLPGLDTSQRQDVGFNAETARGVVDNLLILISLVILPPLAEELLFRGVLYTGLRKRLTVLAAGTITSIVFALGHLQGGQGGSLIWLAAVDTLVLSMILVYVREKSGSLWPGIIIHATKNIVAFGAIFVFYQ